MAPDPTSIVFITLSVETSTTIADIATLLFCTSLFAASLSFHNAVARYFFALGRARVLFSAFARTNRQGAPYIGSLTQTLIAALVVFIFWQSDNDPVLQLFTWLTNLGALGVILLLALASFAVVGYFSRHPHEETAWTSRYAPAIAGVALTFIFFLVLGNFNTLITGAPDAPGDDRSVILPAILIGGAIIGILVGLWIKSTKPDVYARIGEMGEEDGHPG
jgi:amino acid transporter